MDYSSLKSECDTFSNSKNCCRNSQEFIQLLGLCMYKTAQFNMVSMLEKRLFKKKKKKRGGAAQERIHILRAGA